MGATQLVSSSVGGKRTVETTPCTIGLLQEYPALARDGCLRVHLQRAGARLQVADHDCLFWECGESLVAYI